MHNNGAGTDSQQKAMDRPLTTDTASAGLSPSHMDGSLFYHKNHCWIKVVNPYEVVIGINGILSKLMYGIRTVVLPRIGDPVLKNQVFAHIMLEKQIVPLIMPVNGEVIAVNEILEKQPELLRTEFSEKGWLVTIKADYLEKELRTLSFGSTAMAWYRSKEKSVNEALYSACNANGDQLGATMHDGGELIANVSELLTAEQFSTILDGLSS
jgi:glycine cleavage system H protein